MTSYNKSKQLRLSQTRYTYNGDPSASQTYGISTVYYDFNGVEFFSGSDLPGWRSIIRSGGGAMNPASGSRLLEIEGASSSAQETQVIGNVSGQWQVLYTQSSSAAGYSGCLDGAIGYPAHDPLAVNRAKGKYAQKVLSVGTAIQGGVVLGELRETLHMIRHPANAIASSLQGYYNALKKGRHSLQKASRKKKQGWIRGTYLEYTYGWGPLIQDIKSGAEALARYQNSRPPRTYLRQSSSSETSVTQQAGGSIGSLGFACNLTLKTKTRCSIYGAYDTTQPEKQDPLKLLGFNGLNFLPTVWELIPYSFLVDYFVNIGDMITAASANLVTPVFSGLSNKSTLEVTADSYQYNLINVPLSTEPNDPHGGLIQRLDPGKNVLTTESFQRQVNPDLMPSFQISLKPSVRRIANVVALLPNFRKLTPF